MPKAATVWHTMHVARVAQEGLQLRHLTLTAPESYAFGCGQYVEVRADGERPACFAIASGPEQPGAVELLVKEGEGVAGRLYAAVPGDTVEVSEPKGPGFPKTDLLGRNVILIGVGSGMAPLRSVIQSILAARHEYGERVMLIYGARTPFHIPFRTEIAKWRAQIEVYKAMSRPADTDWRGYVGYVQHIVEGLDLPRENAIACVCGMPPMVAAVKERLAALGIPEDDVYLNF
jgi:anaerobic sulfite reductase subunit B